MRNCQAGVLPVSEICLPTFSLSQTYYIRQKTSISQKPIVKKGLGMLRQLLPFRSTRNHQLITRKSLLFRIVASRSNSTDIAQQEDPNFHEMTEYFIENARCYVEERLTNRPEGRGKRPITREQRKQSVKGIDVA